MSKEIRIPLKTYLETLTINGLTNKTPQQKRESTKQIETITGYPYPLISLAVTQGHFKITGGECI